MKSENTDNHHVVFIPCFNCERQIKRVIHHLKNQKFSQKPKFVFIDNCSSDGTAQVIKHELNNLSKVFHCVLICNEQNYGLGGSFQTAVNWAHEKGFTYLHWFHGDDQSSTTDLSSFIELCSTNDYDAVFGSRFSKESQLFNYSKLRNLGNRLLNHIFSKALNSQLSDLGSGLSSFKISTLPLKRISMWPTHIAFDIQLIFHYFDKKQHYSAIYKPIIWREEDQVSNANNLKVALLLLNELLMFKLGLNNVEKNARNYTFKEFDFNNADGWLGQQDPTSRTIQI